MFFSTASLTMIFQKLLLSFLSEANILYRLLFKFLSFFQVIHSDDTQYLTYQRLPTTGLSPNVHIQFFIICPFEKKLPNSGLFVLVNPSPSLSAIFELEVLHAVDMIGQVFSIIKISNQKFLIIGQIFSITNTVNQRLPTFALLDNS